MAGFFRTLFDPRVSDHLISDEGEIVVDEVRRHPAAFVGPGAVGLLGILIMISTLWVPVVIAWLPLLVGLVLLGIGGYKMLSAHMDRFVITNMRVFRVHGIFSQHTETMPMARILDISVHKPLVGRILDYGHFVFESAAENQGLRDIRYVAHPDQRDLTIQRVIQRSGLRSSMRPLGHGSPGSPATPASATRDSGLVETASAAQGDGIGDDIPDMPDNTPEQSNAEWLAAGWSAKDSADYRSAAPRDWQDSDRS